VLASTARIFIGFQTAKQGMNICNWKQDNLEMGSQVGMASENN